MNQLVKNAKNVFINNFNIQKNEQVLIVTDDQMVSIAKYFYEAAKALENPVTLIQMPAIFKSGEEPPTIVAQAMLAADVILCITKASLTHTKARKNASSKGARIGTMPGITEDMLEEGAITADPSTIKKLTAHYTDLLTNGSSVKIEKEGYVLEFSIAGRQGIPSTGIFHNKGESGNIPSGESYIAPIEESANGKLYIDGSIAGLGKVTEPVILTIKDGRIIDATGEMGARLLEILGNENGRIIAEFGIGTNPNARITGVVLEDEKVFKTIHIAFGSNQSFGGKNDAGVHIDCVVTNPKVWIDGEPLTFDLKQ